jgi:hypothetical protein
MHRVYDVEIGGGVKMACAEGQDGIVQEAVLLDYQCLEDSDATKCRTF